MTDTNRNIEDDKITLRELLQRGWNLIDYLTERWKVVAVCIAIGGLAGILYTFKRPVYTAETTFALEESSNMNQLSGLASSVGINMGALAGEEENLFKGENILELYKSKRMLIETILQEVNYEGTPERLIYPFARELEWDEKWASKSYLKDISFDIPREQFTHHHDSILLEVVEELQDKYVGVDKPSRRLNIISVKVFFKDPIFAKAFNAQLVKVVNDFYYESRTRKSSETIATFQHQVDSIRAAINASMVGIASTMETTPNLNALYRSKTVPVQEQQIDLQVSLAAYSEIVKNLELSKLSHFENQPLIQIIDRPLNYLENDRWRWYKGLAVGLFLGGFLSVVFFTFKQLFESALKAEEQPAD